MKKKSIESIIRLSVFFIYLFAALTCGGVVFYFYAITRNIDIRKEAIRNYYGERQQVHALIQAVNEAQADVNLYVVTRNSRYFRQYRIKSQEIDARMDSLIAARTVPQIDSVLSEVTALLKRKEEAIVLLNRQFHSNTPIDSLPRRLSLLTSALQQSAPVPMPVEAESFIPESEPVTGDEPETVEQSSRKGFFRGIADIFSPRKEEPDEIPLPEPEPLPVWDEPDIPEFSPFLMVEADSVEGRDTTLIHRFVEQTRVEYNLHLSAIGSQVNSIILADQQINSRITELLTGLYSRIVNLRIEELETDEALIRRNNNLLLIIGGSALLAILGLLILILRYVNRAYTARQKLEQANQRNRQLMESRHKLLLSVSHDVKTPLNSILGYTDIYRQKGVLNAEQSAPIRQAGNHILTLLHNLLEFSSLEKGTLTLSPVHFNLMEWCTGICDMCRPLFSKKSLDFDFRPHFDPQTVLYADSLKMKQILTNLLSNAVKYTTEGSVAFEVFLDDSAVEFRVTDTGAGIPSDKRKLLFRPFSRIGETNAAEEGSGYGLYVVKGLVDLFGGSISVWSEPGHGSRFSVKLPVEKGEITAPDKTCKNILLIDDDRIYLDMLSGWCRQLGHTATMCSSLQELEAELVPSGRYDAVLTDMELGSFSGEDVLKSIRAADTGIPVILVSGRPDFTDAAVREKGFSGYLPKPVTLSDLYHLLGGKKEDAPHELLSGFLGGDKKAGEEFMGRFFLETVDRIIQLEDAVRNRNFEICQSLCHKMLPMFLQLKAPQSVTDRLKEVDGLRGKPDAADQEFWRGIEKLPGLIEVFLEDVREKYLSD